MLSFSFYYIVLVYIKFSDLISKMSVKYNECHIYLTLGIYCSGNLKCIEKINLSNIFNYIYLEQMEQEAINATLIKRLLKYTEQKEVDEELTKISKSQTQKLTEKIVEQIDNGQIPISNSQADFESYINHNTKQEALKNIYQSDDYYNYERDLRIMKGMTISQIESYVPIKRPNRKKVIKQQQQIQHKKSQQEIKRDFLQKMKHWQEQRAKILKKKKEIETKKKSLQVNSEEKSKKESEQINAFLKLQKKKIIEAKLRQIQQRKAKRHQNLHQSAIRKSQSVPKYVEAEKRFQNQQIQKQLQNQIKLRNRRQQLQVKMQEVKQHQRQYIQRIKQRLNMKSQNNNALNKSNDGSSKSIESFNLNKKDPEQMRKIEEKIKRMKKIQNKIRLMPLKIDPQKQKQIQILGDKLKNKKKYNFLSQKALSDQLIYEEFKDFDINIDKKQLGNKYFQEFKSENQRLGKRKVSSQKVLPSNRPEYKNYIPQIRQKKSNILNPDEFDTIVKKVNNSKDKSAEKKYLLAKSQQFEEKAIQKIYELRKMENYHDAVKKQEQIDKSYMKAIQAKLALAKIQ